MTDPALWALMLVHIDGVVDDNGMPFLGFYQTGIFWDPSRNVLHYRNCWAERRVSLDVPVVLSERVKQTLWQASTALAGSGSVARG